MVNACANIIKGRMSSLCGEYEAVYNAMKALEAAPVGVDPDRQNKLVKNWVNHGVWDAMDYINPMAIHSNDNGIALLNWKQPAGGSDVVQTTDFSDAGTWTAPVNVTASGNLTYQTSGSGGVRQAGESLFTAGKYYLVTAIGTATGNIQVCNYAALAYYTITGGGAFSGATVIKATSDGLYLRHTVAGTVTFTTFTIQEWTNALAVNSPTFTASQGFQFDGATDYVNSRFTPSVDGVNYTQNSASQILYVRTNISPVGTPAHGTGGNADSKDCFVVPSYNGTTTAIRINDNNSSTDLNNNGSGMYVNTRTAAAVKKLYRNKVAIINGTTISTGVPTHAFYVGCYNDDDVAAGFRADQVALDAYGAGFNQTLVDYMTDDFEEYMDSYGTGVIS